MGHELVSAAEAILDKEFQVLNHGFCRLVDYLGSDQRILDAARVSYGKQGAEKTPKENAGLINYLMQNRHSSPFEQVQLTFHTKMPVFVARQWVRHRTARLNEISGRYSVMKDEFYVPDLQQICYQATDNKQGRSGPLPPDEALSIYDGMSEEQATAYTAYLALIDKGVAKETARMNLPLSLYTEWYWQIDLHNLFHFLKLRLDSHAQYEIRVYAEVMADMARAVAPMAYAAFEDHVLNTVTFSKSEQQWHAIIVCLLFEDACPHFPVEATTDYVMQQMVTRSEWVGVSPIKEKTARAIVEKCFKFIPAYSMMRDLKH
jgi:thymidylate synthase (FAD)